MTDLGEKNSKMIKDYRCGKSVMLLHQPGISYFSIATILKNKNKVTDTVVEGFASLEIGLMKIGDGPVSAMEKFLMTHIKDKAQYLIPSQY